MYLKLQKVRLFAVIGLLSLAQCTTTSESQVHELDLMGFYSSIEEEKPLDSWYEELESRSIAMEQEGTDLSSLDDLYASIEANLSKIEATPSKSSKKKRTRAVTVAYIDKYALIAVQEQDLYGIPASITIAQGILESASGTSNLSVSSNNHFGIKCKSHKGGHLVGWYKTRVNGKWKKVKSAHEIEHIKQHCHNYHDDNKHDRFVKFDSPWWSYRFHSKLLMKGSTEGKIGSYGWMITKYPVGQGKYVYKEWAKGLKKSGYATSPTYAEKLIALIELHELYKYDKV